MGHSISIVALRNICNESVYNGIRRHLRRVSPRFVKNDALACEFLAWAWVLYRGKTEIRIIDKGTKVNSHYYINNVIKPFLIVVVVLLFYVHGKHLRSCQDGQLT